MISNSSYAPIINTLLEEMSQQGLNGLKQSLKAKFFSQLMKVEKVLQAMPYERTEAKKGLYPSSITHCALLAPGA